MDGVSAAASIIALVETASRIVNVCFTYFVAVKDARVDIQKLQGEMMSFQSVLTRLADHVALPESAMPLLTACAKDLQDLSQILSPGDESANTMRKFGIRAMRWPFSSKETEKHLSAITRHKTTLSLALEIETSTRILEDATEMRNALSRLELEFKDEGVRIWLDPPDVTDSLDAALMKRTVDGTGSWCIEGPNFQDWFKQPASTLWLSGIPGSGKTILCSSLVQWLSCQSVSTSDANTLYFFFDSGNHRDMHPVSMVRSLIWQLAPTSSPARDKLQSCFSQLSQRRQRSRMLADLLGTLHSMIQVVGQVHIVVDAADESPDQDKLIDVIQTMVGWKLPNLHILLSCRPTPAFQDIFDELSTHRIAVEGAGVDADIDAYIERALKSHSRLRSLQAPMQDKIRKRLSENAHGMFRWVQCHIDGLSRCLTAKSIAANLEKLPLTLEKTYEQILLGVEPEYEEYVRTILLWVCCARVPLTLDEVADITALDPVTYTYDEDCRIMSADIRLLCPELITIENSNVHQIAEHNTPTTTVRLAHASVRDYLMSESIMRGNASHFGVKNDGQNPHLKVAQISTICLSAACEVRNGLLRDLCKYAAQFWTAHARLGFMESQDQSTSCDFVTFMKSDAFDFSLDIFDPDANGQQSPRVHRSRPSNLYYAALAGLDGAVTSLLEEGADVNDYTGSLGTPLHAAVFGKHISTTAILLSNGADCNLRSPTFGDALQLAAIKNSEPLITLLLQHGADPNSPHSGIFGNAMVAATYQGNSAIVKHLLNHGARLETLGIERANALQLACWMKDISIVNLMLAAGLDANGYGQWGWPLQAALTRGDRDEINEERTVEVVKLLLEHGADPNIPSNNPSPISLLMQACRLSDLSTAKTLLESGVLVYTSRKDLDDCVRQAVENNNRPLIELLKHYKPDKEEVVPSLGTALEQYRENLKAGSHSQIHIDQVSQRLEEQENEASRLKDRKLFDLIHRKRGHYLSYKIRRVHLLAHACELNSPQVLRMLLEAGALVPKASPELLKASMGKSGALSLLVDKGLDIQASVDENTLSAAVSTRDEVIVREILDLAALSDSYPSSLMRALRVAAGNGTAQIFELLFERMISSDSDPTKFGDLLHTAADSKDLVGGVKIMRLILRYGGDPNGSDTLPRSPIHLAVRAGNFEAVDLLIEHGANLNGTFQTVRHHGTHNGRTPLQISASLNHAAITRLLVNNGASLSSSTDKESLIYCLLSMERSEWTEEAISEDQENSLIEQLELIVEKDIKLSSPCGGEFGYPLPAAVRLKSVRVLRFLLDNGADINARGERGTALQIAAFRRWVEGMAMLLAAKADTNVRTPPKYDYWPAETALEAAAMSGNGAGVRLLLESGATDVSEDGQLSPAMRLGIIQLSSEVVEELMKFGYSVNPTNNNAVSAVQLVISASLSGSFDQFEARKVQMLNFLLERGASVTSYDSSKESPLALAVEHHCSAIVDILLDHGASVTRYGEGKKCCALCAATAAYKNAYMKKLIDHGADVQHKSTAHESLLHEAMGDPAKIDVLLQAGADPGKPNGDGLYPLQEAIQSWDDERAVQNVRLLHGRGADLSVQTDDSRTLLEVATLKLHIETVGYLLQAGRGIWSAEMLYDLSTKVIQKFRLEPSSLTIDTKDGYTYSRYVGGKDIDREKKAEKIGALLSKAATDTGMD